MSHSMKFSFLKVITTRNAFSREYGTWIIVLLNIVFTPIYIEKFSLEALYLAIAILFFIFFRFELLDLFSLKFRHKKKYNKILFISFLLLLSGLFFTLFYIQNNLSYYLILIPVAGILLTLNIKTRRRKKKRQHIVAQIVLTGSFGFISSLFYYVLTENIDATFWQVGICNALYYINSTLYVRSKTVGAPFDSYAILFTIFIYIFGWILISNEIVDIRILLLYLPTFIKGLDNVVLANFKVPLRRIGVNETFHSILFIVLYNISF